MKRGHGRPDDRRLERLVERALERMPELDGSDIHVYAVAGVVTLSGRVLRLAEKRTAGDAAAAVKGVRGVANDLGVRFLTPIPAGGAETAIKAVAALGWNVLVPKNAVVVVVENGWLTLEGIVDWQYQKRIAGREVRGVGGLRGVTNNIAVRPHSPLEVCVREH